MLLLTLLGSAWTSYQYARLPIDPDFALFSLPAFCSSWPGRDFEDCKSHGIYLWFWTLAKLVGASVFRVRFAHHFIVGAGGALAAWALTGNEWSAVAIGVLVNSGWLWAFHGNVGQVPAVLLLGALGLPGAWGPLACLALAVFIEPKLAPSAMLMALLRGWVWQGLAVAFAAGCVFGVITVVRPAWAEWMIEMNVTTPARMHKARAKLDIYRQDWCPWHSAQALVYLMPWVTVAVWARPSLFYWLPLVVYVILVGYGRVVRPVHLFPVAAWVAMAQPDPALVLMLAATDYMSSGFYTGEVWLRFYGSLDAVVKEAKLVGEWLRSNAGAGTVWVNSISTEVYLWARRPVLYYMTEQAEMREGSPRREEMRRRWQANPPDWVVIGPFPGMPFRPIGYRLVHRVGQFSVLRKESP